MRRISSISNINGSFLMRTGPNIVNWMHLDDVGDTFIPVFLNNVQCNTHERNRMKLTQIRNKAEGAQVTISPDRLTALSSKTTWFSINKQGICQRKEAAIWSVRWMSRDARLKLIMQRNARSLFACSSS